MKNEIQPLTKEQALERVQEYHEFYQEILEDIIQMLTITPDSPLGRRCWPDKKLFVGTPKSKDNFVWEMYKNHSQAEALRSDGVKL